MASKEAIQSAVAAYFAATGNMDANAVAEAFAPDGVSNDPAALRAAQAQTNCAAGRRSHRHLEIRIGDASGGGPQAAFVANQWQDSMSIVVLCPARLSCRRRIVPLVHEDSLGTRLRITVIPQP